MKISSACSFIYMQIKVIFIRIVSHLNSLWNRGTRELGNGLLVTPIVIYLFFYFSCFFARIICCLVVWFYSACIHVWLSVSVCLYDCLSFLQSVYLWIFLFTFCNIHLNILYSFVYFVCLFLVYPYIFSHVRSLNNLLLLFVRLFLESLIHTFQCEKLRNPSRSCKPFGFMEDFIMYSDLPRKVCLLCLVILLEMDNHPCHITAKQTPKCTTNSL